MVINEYLLSIQQGCAPVSRAQTDAPCETGAPRLKTKQGGQLNSLRHSKIYNTDTIGYFRNNHDKGWYGCSGWS